MRYYYICFLFLSCNSAIQHYNNADSATCKKSLLNKWQADSTGMKKYFFVYLKKGENRNAHSEKEIREIQKAHLQNIDTLAKQGKILLAGPFLDNTETRGIFIMNCKDSAECAALISTDKAITSGRLKAEIHPWFGSAALMELPHLYNKIR